MILDLDDDRALDPGRVGAKAAWLARGRRVGLPVLPGVVVPADASKPYLRTGADTLLHRGSGGARLVISQSALPDDLLDEILTATSRLEAPLVVRSSSVLEGSGEWSGAFTSYLDLDHTEVAKAVTGCWASVFTVATLERFEAAQIDPVSAPMAVLIQPALRPEFGGTARIDGDEVTVIGVRGSPAPLVQGWDPGVHARVSPDLVIRGDDATALLGDETITMVAKAVRTTRDKTGANACEWAVVGGEVVLLQLLRSPERHGERSEAVPELTGSHPIQIARLVRRYPGPMGEALVLPWAVASPDVSLDDVGPADKIGVVEALRSATEHADALTAEVWGLPKTSARMHARDALRALRGSEPAAALAAFERLRPVDAERSRHIRRLLGRVRAGLVGAGVAGDMHTAWHVDPDRVVDLMAGGQRRQRIGFDRWEPFDAAVVLSNGRSAQGTSAGPGIAAGRMCFVTDHVSMEAFRPRDVVVAAHPLPSLAQLLWDAAAVVTTGGSPAAHLFESARALAIPAVCGIHLDDALDGRPALLTGARALAVDGHAGTVHAMIW